MNISDIMVAKKLFVLCVFDALILVFMGGKVVFRLDMTQHDMKK